MFIFTVIEPDSVCFNNDLVNPFTKLVKEDFKLREFFEDSAAKSFILTQDKKREIYGGALLYKKKLNFLPSKISKELKSFSFPEGNIWACTLCFHLKNNNFPSEFEVYFKDLYKNLYEELSQFGAKEKTSILYMILQPAEYLCSEVLGLWPYRLEIRPMESSDRLFHGVLPLIAPRSQTFIRPYDRNSSFGAAF